VRPSSSSVTRRPRNAAAPNQPAEGRSEANGELGTQSPQQCRTGEGGSQWWKAGRRTNRTRRTAENGGTERGAKRYTGNIKRLRRNHECAKCSGAQGLVCRPRLRERTVRTNRSTCQKENRRLRWQPRPLSNMNAALYRNGNIESNGPFSPLREKCIKISAITPNGTAKCCQRPKL